MTSFPPSPSPAGGPLPDPRAASRPSWAARIAAGLGILGAVLNAWAPLLGQAAPWVCAAQTAWAVGNLLWLAYALRTRQRALAAQHAAFLLISFAGLANWGWAAWRLWL